MAMSVSDYIRIVFGSPMQVMSDCTRGFVIPAPGHDFIGCDLSSIESRKLAWLAGEEYKLEIFRGHGKIYEFNAAGIFRRPMEDITKDQRQVGKVAELAFGFGGGKGAFHQMAKNFGLKFTDNEAEGFKNAWRELNPNTVKYWYALEEAAKNAILNPGKTFEAGARGREIKYKKNGSWLWCRLPSGRVICYPYAKVEPVEVPWGMRDGITYMAEDSFSKKFEKTTTYGGSLCENVTQASSACILREGMREAKKRGYPIVLHVHDELVAEVPEGFGSVKEMEEFMTIVPAWAQGLPLAAEGWRGKRFRK